MNSDNSIRGNKYFVKEKTPKVKNLFAQIKSNATILKIESEYKTATDT